MERAIAGLVMLSIILMAGVGGISAQYDQSVTESQNQTSITNESFTADLGTAVALTESNRDVIYNETVTVFNSSNVEVSQSGNYTFFAANGTLRINSSTTQFTQGESGTVSYQFTEPTNQHRAVKDVSLIIPNVLGETILFVMGLAVLLGGTWMAGKST